MKQTALLIVVALLLGLAGGCGSQQEVGQEEDSILLASSEGDVRTFTGGHSVKRRIETGTELAIIAEEHPNLLMRSYHLNKKVSQTGIVSRMFGRFDSFSGDEVTPEMEELSAILLGIEGLDTDFSFDTHDISVGIGLAFDWKEIEPQVIEAIKKVYGSS